MKKHLTKVLCSLLFLLLSGSYLANAQTPTASPTPTTNKSTQLGELSKKIAELEGKVSELKSQKASLSSQISVMDNQIKLAEFRIAATEKQIMDLTLDIDAATKRVKNLESSLDNVSKVLINRIVATYQAGGVEPMHVIFSSNDISDLITRANYLKIVQAHDKKLMYNAQQARNDYEHQKNIFEDKKAKIEALKTQLEAYNKQLDEERKNKENLLAQTKGSEARYQALLAETKAEYEAIQGIVSGRGKEGEIGPVSEGSVIATVKVGASCNSSGTHLHFTVSRNGATENPFSYLKPIDHNNQAGDPFNPSGSWEWPMNPTIQFHQGYGNTSFASSGASFYSFHNGIDISGSSTVVKAVRAGTLFQGSYTGQGGCRLQYVRVHHTDDGLDTFYLHVNYVN
jgi:peptidoglycan hydrolase CwlO-like protein